MAVGGKETDTYQFRLPESARQHAKSIDAALTDIKLRPGHCGSGAFPVGLLHEIINARLALASRGHCHRPPAVVAVADCG